MKKFRFIFIVVALCGFTIAACSMYGDDDALYQLIGKWQWVRSAGGFAGRVITPDSVGHGSYTVFRIDRTFSVFVADTLVKTGQFHLKNEDGKTTISYSDITYFPPRNHNYPFLLEQWVRFRGKDTLILRDRCADCYTTTFVRVR